MHVRIQTNGKPSLGPHPPDSPLKFHTNPFTLSDTTTALEALEKGFNDLMDLCDVVTEKFTAARDQFKEDRANMMEG